MMNVEIDNGDAIDPARLEHAGGHRHVVEGTKAFTVIREGVVQTAADVDRRAKADRRAEALRHRRVGVAQPFFLFVAQPFPLFVAQPFRAAINPARKARGIDGPADHQSEAVDHLLRPGKLELRDFFGGNGAAPHLLEVLGCVHQRELFPARRLGLHDVGVSNEPELDQASVNQAVLESGKNVRPDIDVISGRINDRQFERPPDRSASTASSPRVEDPRQRAEARARGLRQSSRRDARSYPSATRQ